MPFAVRYRYGAILGMLAVIVAFAIGVAPEGEFSRVSTSAALAVTLIVAIATTGMTPSRRWIFTGVVAIMAGSVAASAVIDGEREWLASAVSALLVLAIAIALGRGLRRMLRERGVTTEAVAGGLAIYLLIGLFFATITGVVADLSSQPYFEGDRTSELGERIYFSFTALTTTGFGDPVAATSVGKSIAVSEMLIGQIYLVTVIALLVSHARVARGGASAT